MWKNLAPITRKLYSFTNCNGNRPLSAFSYCSVLDSCGKTIRMRNSSLQFQRSNTNYFNKLPAEEIWKGVTSVSNPGKKRGRGKGVGKKSAKNLNRGQIIGVGKANIIWPGLNAPVIRGRELVQQQQLPPDPDREKKLIELRDKMGVFRPLRLSPIERGWSGSKMPGRSIGPPDPIGGDSFEGFDTKVLELKLVVTMKGNMGRKRSVSSLAVTGNGRGLAGFALGKANNAKSSLRMARNRAGQKLVYIEIYKNHTVFHDFFCQFGKTKIFIQKKPEGYGLKCHRAIRTICEILGIKDLYAKVEGPTNLGHIVKAFFLGLIQQKTHQVLAEEKKLHLVEFRKENSNHPEVVGSPSVVRSPQEVPSTEVLDYNQYCMGNRVVLRKKKYPPFYTKLPFWPVVVKKKEHVRNHDKTRLRLMTEYGDLRSFLTDKYPECRPHYREKTEEDPEAT